MPTLYFMSGYPFAGKTTIAKIAVATLGLVVVSLDDVFMARGHGQGAAPESLDTAEYKAAYAEYFRIITDNLRAGRSVLVDSVGYRRETREVMRRLAADCGATARLLFVDAPRELSEQRWQANRQNGQRQDVSDAIYKQVVTSFERPGEDEAPLVFGPAMSEADIRGLLERAYVPA